ncbi:MAG TPA: hypothetical protein VFO57_07465 [Burkholderiales bacterium]|nr:hypothetical protein [Burkholderiales bacterium]
MRVVLGLLLCVPLAGCYVNMHGVQSTNGGTTTTVTATQVSGLAKFGNGTVAFSSGQVPPPGAPGGHLRWSGSASGAILAGVVVAELLGHLVGWNRPKPLPEGTLIMHTCSCFQQPASGEQ